MILPMLKKNHFIVFQGNRQISAPKWSNRKNSKKKFGDFLKKKW
jgi:hypothetical protein